MLVCNFYLSMANLFEWLSGQPWPTTVSTSLVATCVLKVSN